MSEHRIVTDDYRVDANRVTHTITFAGHLRLENTPAYEPIINLMNNILEQNPPQMTLDLKGLEVLNSSGINALNRFLMGMKDSTTKVIVKASKEVPWQSRMLSNVHKVMPHFELSLE